MKSILRTFLLGIAMSISISSIHAQIYINELLASNGTGITDETGAFEDWIEIYNASDTDVNLAGYYISDNIAEPLLWQIPIGGEPSLTTVPAGGYLILWADKKIEEGANHVNIKLGAGGEDLIITDPDGLSIVDQLTFGPQTVDISYGRETDGAANFIFFSSPSPGAENIAGASPTYTVTLEIPIANSLDDGEQFPGGSVTLTSSDIEMVQDGGSVYTAAFRFTNIELSSDAIINNAYIQFVAEEVQTGASDLTINAELSGDAPPLQMLANNITSRPSITASANWTPAPWSTVGAKGADQQTSNLSTLVEEIISNPTWDAGNAMVFMFSGSGTRTTYSYDQNPTNAATLIIEAEIPLPTVPIPTVYINEVSANSSSFMDESGTNEDWVELYNPNAEDIDLGGLYLSDNLGDLDKWQISLGTIIPAGGYLVFITDNDDEEGPLHTNFSLKAGGEEVVLSQLLADGLTIIDELSYEDMPFLATYGRETDGASNFVLFGAVSPGTSNNGADLHLPSPVFSIPSGAYSTTQTVAISSIEPETTIYYTTDGSYPTINSTLYTGAPINVSTTSSLRAIAIKSGYTDSQPSDATYLINENKNIPILYITTDPDNFFDDEIGLYVDGTNGVVAYCATQPVNWARDWERPINLKMFLPNGELAFDVDAGAEINGACSRNLPMKSLGINLRDKVFGDDAIEYPLFPERAHENYQRLKIRNSGQDFIRLGFRDMVNQNMITGKLDIDLQGGRPALLYINGAFWGIHNIREKYVGEYFEAIYGLNENDLDIIKSPGLPYREEKRGTDDIYNALYGVVASSDMNNESDWTYFQSQVDVNEMMNYWITMTYMNNYDWPANNLTVWRERKEGAKWRYGIADTDGSTQNNLSSDAAPSYNKFERIINPNISNWPDNSNSTLFLRKSLDRQEFRDEFIQRSCSVIELLYNTDRVHSFIDETVALFAPNVQDHIDRWGFGNAMGGSVASWNNWVALYRDFYDQRPAFWRQHVNDLYNLDGYYDLTVSFDANSGGAVFVNTNEMELPFNYVGTYFKNIPLHLKAVANPGYVFQFWLETGNTNAEIDFVGDSNTTLTPIFQLLDCTQIEPGTACNDGDNCTVNDAFDAACNCAGTFADADTDGVCDAEDQCPGFDDTIDLDGNGIPDGCDLICTDNDGDLICLEDDCDDTNPNLPAPVGSACDDGDATTTGDIIQDDGCTCMGSTIGGPANCSVITAIGGPNQITISNLVAEREEINIIGAPTNWQNILVCDENCANTETIADLIMGTYSVKINNYGDDGSYCYFSVNVEVTDASCTDADDDGFCQADDCDDSNPSIPAAIGSTCDDGDATTTGDVIQDDGCTCLGMTPCTDADDDGFCQADDCDDSDPSIPAAIGSTCDDGDATTTGDVIQDDGCTCLGMTPCTDADDDGFCQADDCDDSDPSIPAAIGSTCDDGDATTTGDVIQDDGCTCMGITPCTDADDDGFCQADDCDDSDPSIPAAIGSTCDDGDATTTGDVIQDDGCTCLGVSGPFDCATIIAVGGNGQITISNLLADREEIKVIGAPTNWQNIAVCDDDCDNTEIITGLNPGTYSVKINNYGEESGYCYFTMEVEVTDGPCTDEDEDGVCASEDCDDEDATIPATVGSACDDGDTNTINDVIQADGCSCMGVNLCPNGDLPITPGTTCDDGDGATENDVIQSDGCTCLGMIPCTDNDGDGFCLADDCDDMNNTIPAPVGTPCDDGDEATTNDVIQADGCACAGTVPNTDPTCSDMQISFVGNTMEITGLTAPIEIVKVFRENWTIEFNCVADCGNSLTIPNLSPQTYHISINMYTAGWNAICDDLIDFTYTGFTDSQQQNNSRSRIASISDFQVYPNPATDQLTIAVPKSFHGEQLNLTLINTLGKSAIQETIDINGSDHYPVNLSTVGTGIYFLQIQNKREVILSKKIVINAER